MNLSNALDRFYYSDALCELKLMNSTFPDKNITYNSLLYIELIFSMSGQCTASKIADVLHISKPAVTLKVNELIKQGFVYKASDPNDSRKNILFVNEEKIPHYKVYRKQDSLAVKRIKEKYSEEDIQKFCEMLEIVSDINFEEINKK